MLKFIFILMSAFVVIFFALHDTWMVTISAFGFEITTSILIIGMAFLFLFYIIHLLKKPFQWFHKYQLWYERRKQSNREGFLVLALRTVLDQDSQSVRYLLKKKNNFFDKKSDESYIIDALFNPTPHVFEQLLHREQTELAGVRGLLNYAKKTGDLTGANVLLQKAIEKYPNELWVQEAQWTLQTLQNDWSEALKTLDILKKKESVSKDEYRNYKSSLLLKLGQGKEAFKLYPENPETAIAYAKAEPQKAVSILLDSWKKTPCWDTYLLFRQAIQSEKSAKRIKLTEKLIKDHPESRLAHLALAQAYADGELWGKAKEELTTCLNEYSLTPTMAYMMAELERNGWHHEEAAKSWEQKALTAFDEQGWGCSACGHKTTEWDAVCPKCNTFGTIKYK